MKFFSVMLVMTMAIPINSYAVCGTFNNKPLCTSDNERYNIISSSPQNKPKGSSTTTTTNSTTNKTYINNRHGQQTTSNRTQSYRFSYEESNGVIDTASVCKEYEYGSIDQRQCRHWAVGAFKRNCDENARLASTYRYPENTGYIELRDKFCTASRSVQ
jgi:hypothetical protein